MPDLTGAVGTAALAAPTILAVTVTVKGRAAHAGFAPEEGIHAIAVAARALSQCMLGHVDDDTTVGFGVIRGGTVCNAVPAECVLEGEVRGYRDDRVWEELQQITKIFQREAAAVGAEVTIQAQERVHAYEVSCDSPIIHNYCAACKMVGVSPSWIKTFGGSDANTFAAGGRDTLVIANAMANIHSVEESTCVGEMIRLTTLILALMCLDAENREFQNEKETKK